MDNCVELTRKFPGLQKYFAFFDDCNYSAASLFNRYQVRIKVKGSWSKEGDKYKVILCKVWRKDVPKFIRAMEDLKTKMLLIGNTDYEEFCERFLKQVD